MQAIGLIFFLAILTEGIIEYLGAPIPSAYKPYAAALLGVLVCLAYNADLLGLLGYPAIIPHAGAVLTGLVIGRGSNYVNILISRAQIVALPAATVGAPADAPTVTPVETARS